MTFRLRMLPAVVMAVGGVAAAQPAVAPSSPEGAMPADSTGAPDAAPAGEAMPPAAPGEMSPEGSYTIKTGDTLWDLSQKFLNNPWYWPKIWADNPAVDNPHWIYPGNTLRIHSGGEGMPAEVQPGEADGEGDADEPLPAKKPVVADFTQGSIGQADDLGQSGDLVTSSGRLVFKPQPMHVIVSSIVTDRELAAAGVITASFEQKGMLSNFDRVYVSFADPKSARIGQSFTVFRPGVSINHPVTNAAFGVQTIILGGMKIVGREGDLAIGELSNVSDAIGRGDRVGQAAVLERAVKPVENTRSLDAFIVATEIPRQTWIGEGHVIFIDKGSKDGVQEGNTFQVLQSGDGLTQLHLSGATTAAGMPSEVVAQIMVFDVRDETAAAMVVKSLREVGIGDRVVMRTRGGAGSGGDGR